MIFGTKKKLDAHDMFAHQTESPSTKKILILGGGFGGIYVIRKIQDLLKNEKISISIVNEENYFLFTPMLPQVASGLLNPTNITIPIRIFSKNAKFYQASVNGIDTKQRLVSITRSFDGKLKTLEYDFLVLALGSQNNFYGNKSLEDHSFTIKTIEDALSLRNHAIYMLENAAQTRDLDLQEKLLTFVVVGGGFAGVETIGELNHFIRQSVSHAYPKINEKYIRMILISSKRGILPEVGEKLGQEAKYCLKKAGVEIIVETRASSAGEDFVELSTGERIPCMTMIWAGGMSVNSLIEEIDCEHGKSGQIIVNRFLQMPKHPEVFALGDCAEILDDKTGKPYPPTAQHAIREAKIVSHNLKSLVNNSNRLLPFSFKSKGMMATSGDKVGVASIMGRNIKGWPAWIIWRTYYLLNMPTTDKKVKVGFDWLVDLIFKRELTIIRKLKRKDLRLTHFEKEMSSIKEQILSEI